MSTNMTNLRILLYSDSREEVTQGLVLLEGLVSNYQELVARVQEITGTSSLDDALSALASYTNGRDVVLWVVRQTYAYDQPYCDLKASYRVENPRTWAVEYGVSSISKEHYDFWKQQEDSFLSIYIFMDGHIGYDRDEHMPKFEAIPEAFRFKKNINQEWYNFAGEYDIDLFGGYFVITESFGKWDFELFAGTLEDFIVKFNVPDNRTLPTAPTQESGKYYLHVRSVERGTFFGTMRLDEPIDFADVTVKYIWNWKHWGYDMASISFHGEDWERELDGSMTLDVGSGVTDTVGDIQCTNMTYF